MPTQPIIRLISIILGFIILFAPIAFAVLLFQIWRIKRNIPEELKGGKKIKNEEQTGRGDRDRGGIGRRGRGGGGRTKRANNKKQGFFKRSKTDRGEADAGGGEFEKSIESQRPLSPKPINSNKKSKRIDEKPKRVNKRDWPDFK